MDGTNGTNIRMQFTGARSGAVTYYGVKGSGRQYRGGNNAIDRYANVHPEDVAVLEAAGDWRQVGVKLSEAVAVSVPVAPETPAVELPAEDTLVDAKPVQTAAGVVKRKRVVKAPKNTPLKDLPEA